MLLRGLITPEGLPCLLPLLCTKEMVGQPSPSFGRTSQIYGSSRKQEENKSGQCRPHGASTSLKACGYNRRAGRIKTGFQNLIFVQVPEHLGCKEQKKHYWSPVRHRALSGVSSMLVLARFLSSLAVTVPLLPTVLPPCAPAPIEVSRI